MPRSRTSRARPDFPNLVEALRRRGYADGDLLAVLRGNFLRVFRQALPDGGR